jgi:hypothetical protein
MLDIFSIDHDEVLARFYATNRQQLSCRPGKDTFRI